MLILNLTRGDSGIRVPLHLPATPADVGDVYAKLDQISKKEKLTRIASVVSDSKFLERYFRDKLLDPLDELNELAERLDGMDEQQLLTFEGALNAESINGLEDILHIADSLEDYLFIHGVTTEKELGEFLVASGYKEFSEAVKPYLDYAAIGTEYYAERGGAFTVDGYTLNWQLLLSYYVSGIPVDLIHATATVLFLWLAAEPMLEKLDRIKVKYGLYEP